jgi:hypothetical protein
MTSKSDLQQANYDSEVIGIVTYETCWVDELSSSKSYRRTSCFRVLLENGQYSVKEVYVIGALDDYISLKAGTLLKLNSMLLWQAYTKGITVSNENNEIYYDCIN